ncbi:dienelactone hydrolase family protein [Aurantimonas sp. VKM B-3413]|uniref:dienelactone hydrolase family protein n=1 Tax=Aurantimonas sp. VKM B-3413 TaxID=2779401 RepID=UPI001E6196DC|nr:dienelactone hydrolase family protein [Aurantimonas sp. VKM B-3413]MCB8836648.1 dienelactone hydrolase family protein [Aurantimonas sp. VKM B-3413]
MAKQDITIKTSDGTVPAGIFTPSETTAGARAGVILYMDAFGLRPALDGMAERLAEAGYVVLVPDLFYRFGDYGPLDAKTAFSEPDTKAKIMGMIGDTTQAKVKGDTGHFLRTLVENGVDGPVGTVGYCMGGKFALGAAAYYPDKVAAGASFHGGGLANDDPDAPHRLAGEIRGRIYVGAASTDRSFPPEQSTKLADAMRLAEVDFTLENYKGMQHGWTVPDHGVYDEGGAERHWRRLLTFFEETLKA